MNIANVLCRAGIGLSEKEYERRQVRAREGLAAAGIDALVVTGPENIFYLTGQQTPGYYTFQALVLPAAGDPVFVIRQLEYFNFIANTFIADAEIYQDGDEPVWFLVAVIENAVLSKAGRDRQAWLVPSDRHLRSAAGPIGSDR